MKAFRTTPTPGHAGFTLAEMMMVLAIMGMLLSMSIAAYSSLLQSKGIEGARKTIEGAIFSARMKAIQTRSDATVVLATIDAEETGFVFGRGGANLYVLNRMVRLTDPGPNYPDDVERSARKGWAGKFTGKYAMITGGTGSGGHGGEIADNNEWTLRMKESLKAWNNSFVSIYTPPVDPEDLPEQYKVTSDYFSGVWEALPKFIHVDGTGFPITFRPDGMAAMMYGAAKIRLRDMRTDDDYWTWMIVVDRSGRTQSVQLVSGSPDSIATWKREN